MAPTDQGQQAPTLLGWAGADLHNAIMNLPCNVPKGYAPGKADEAVYRIGHRDARHAAAELVVTSGLSDMLEALTEIYVALEDHQDVVDGADGEQRPNQAMSLLTEFGPLLRAAIAKAQGGTQ